MNKRRARTDFKPDPVETHVELGNERPSTEHVEVPGATGEGENAGPEIPAGDKVKGAAQMVAGAALAAAGVPMCVLPGPGAAAIVGGVALASKGQRTFSGRKPARIEEKLDHAAAKMGEVAKEQAAHAAKTAAHEAPIVADRVAHAAAKHGSALASSAVHAVAKHGPSVANKVARGTARGVVVAARAAAVVAKAGGKVAAAGGKAVAKKARERHT